MAGSRRSFGAPAGSAASSPVGDPCWFTHAGGTDLPGSGATQLALAPMVDGASGTGVVVDPGDVSGETLLVATAGTYMVTAMVTAFRAGAEGTYATFSAAIQLNDDSVGPAYQFSPVVDITTAAQVATLAFPLVLAEDDTLQLYVRPSTDDTTPPQSGFACLTLVRLG